MMDFMMDYMMDYMDYMDYMMDFLFAVILVDIGIFRNSCIMN